jgi:hypothetical protein
MLKGGCPNSGLVPQCQHTQSSQTSSRSRKGRHLSSLPTNFEVAYFGQYIKSGKPYNALTYLMNNNEASRKWKNCFSLY